MKNEDEDVISLNELYDGVDVEDNDDDDESSISVSETNVIKLGGKSKHNDDLDDDPEHSDWDDDDEEEDDSNDDDNDDDNGEVDIIKSLLLSRGIQNPNEIQYINEAGEIEKHKFSELPVEDQLNILKGQDEYADDEIETINFLRENDISFQDAIKYYQRQAIDEYISNNTDQQYSVDDFSNEELFLADMDQRFPEMSVEEKAEALELEQTNTNLFDKKMARLRQDYKELEDKAAANAKAIELEKAEDEYKEFKTSIVKSANNISNIGGIDLEHQDKEDIASFILSRDPNGQTKLSKALTNPENVFKIAWFLSKGNEAFDMLHNYYDNELKKKSRQVQPSSLPKNLKPGKNNSLVIKSGDKSKKHPSILDMDY